MSKTNQGLRRKLLSWVAVAAVLGYLGSYIPALLSFWNETWYPHGREPRVVEVPKNTDQNVLQVQEGRVQWEPSRIADPIEIWQLPSEHEDRGVEYQGFAKILRLESLPEESTAHPPSA